MVLVALTSRCGNVRISKREARIQRGEPSVVSRGLSSQQPSAQKLFLLPGEPRDKMTRLS